MDSYERGGHTKYSLKVHVILVTKYRKPLFQSASFDEDVKQYLFEGAKRFGCRVLEMETDRDHVHVLLSYSPKACVSTVVANLKRYSTYRAWQAYGLLLQTQYWKRKTLWSDGYFACSIGEASQATIERYIRQQG